MRELELERRKVRELQDLARERDKEYQKLKVRPLFRLIRLITGVLQNHFEKIKRKTLISSTLPAEMQKQIVDGGSLTRFHDATDKCAGVSRPRPNNTLHGNVGGSINAVVGDMEAHKVVQPLI
jgi:hypothetical protein